MRRIRKGIGGGAEEGIGRGSEEGIGRGTEEGIGRGTEEGIGGGTEEGIGSGIGGTIELSSIVSPGAVVNRKCKPLNNFIVFNGTFSINI